MIIIIIIIITVIIILFETYEDETRGGVDLWGSRPRRCHA
jgi:hypothetical protein